MNPDAYIILISGATGILIGGILGCCAATFLAHRSYVRASKDAWAAANRYYTHKAPEP